MSDVSTLWQTNSYIYNTFISTNKWLLKGFNVGEEEPTKIM